MFGEHADFTLHCLQSINKIGSSGK